MKLPFALPRQVWFAVFGVALLLVFGWVATQSGPLAPIEVTTTQVVRGEVTPALFGIGVVEARRAYLIGPTTAGRVRRVLVDVGDSVKAGQLLAEMDPVDLDARVASASAAATRARSAEATTQAQVRDAQSRQAMAASEARRYVDLADKSFVSASAVESKQQQLQSAEAQLAAAEATLSSARQDRSRLEADRDGVRQQRQSIRLEAPVEGLVILRSAEPGSTVVAGQAVLQLVEPTSLWVKVRLDQSRSTGLRTALPAQITLRSSAGTPRPGKVVRVEPVSDSVTEERIAQVAFDLMPQNASIGEMAEVILHLPAIRDALLVPNASLRYRGAQTGVWLRADGKMEFAPVKTGAESPSGSVQILEGLKAGDEVIVYSSRELKNDSRIKVVESLVRPAK